MCLAQGRVWGSNPGPLGSEFDALRLHHRAPLLLLGRKLDGISSKALSTFFFSLNLLNNCIFVDEK